MFILKSWVKYYTREIAKALKVTSVGAGIIVTMICVKYKPAYEVDFAGTKLGFIENKDKIELKIKKYMEDTTGNIAFREQAAAPEYKLKLIERNRETQEAEVIAAVENSTITTYRTYAVTIDGNVQTTVSTQEEADKIVAQMKEGVSEEVGLNVGIIEQYTTDLSIQSEEEASGILNTIKVAKVSEYEAAQEAKRKAEEEEAKKKIVSNKTVKSVGTIAGISLTKPVSGTITSRFGSRSSVRSSSHTGLDIATSAGTSVTPIASGTVTFAAYKGSYGNLVIINHGNGIESYYAHCSAIYVSSGESVDTSTVISAVGSTGNSTGPHLHLEIRQNGKPLNPQNYLY